MSDHRDRWPSKYLFIFAAVGSAVGLGNIWRFPYLVGKYGGGAFIIPYLIALFAIGIPMMIMEFGLGQKMQQGVVGAFRTIDKRLSGVGLGSLITAFGVSAYYAVIMGWCLLYTFYSFNLAWGDDPKTFFFENVIKISGTANQINGISLPVFIGLVLSWILVYFSIWRGVKSVSNVVKVTMPLPIILLLILLFRTITLPHSLDGVAYFLQPNFTALFDMDVWMAAIAQTFFTLSLGFGVMITYASYEEKSSDIVQSALITSVSDGCIALLSGFTVFTTAGYMASQSGQPIAELAGTGPSLAFIVLPKALSLIPGAVFFAIAFFLMLVTLAIDSLFSLVEAIAALFEDQLPHVRKEMIVFFVCLVTFLGGMVFATTAGIYYLDITDHFMSYYGLVLMGLVQTLSVGWVMGAEHLRHYINSVSKIKVGYIWTLMIKYVIPILLTILLAYSFHHDINTPYGEYPNWALWVFGWGLVIFLVITCLGFSYFQAKNNRHE